MRDWAPNGKILFGKGLSDSQRRNLKKSLGICVLAPCRSKAENGLTTCQTCTKKKKETQDLWRAANRDHVNEQARKYSKPYYMESEKRRLANWYGKIKSAFGWSKDKVNATLEAQQYLCAICKQPNNRPNNFGLDHDHQTNQPREFLCHRCNSTLGFVGDSVSLLESMITYLNKHKETPNQLPVRYEGWSDNESGYQGVEKNHSKWAARIMVNKKRFFIGNFNTPQEAYAALEEVKKTS